ncbi:hypothetical protein CPLU01_06931 [Colletotrichum plurivorum]|uniref:Uncharacterized protein n=1 Tax=Colletotrichum plurivorum TaxID=2175906 RepID=A0A8H6NFN3_9PEZI|nr:hypothetical protein CPLU01_06931 [Colletotrichum plurivorum]
MEWPSDPNAAVTAAAHSSIADPSTLAAFCPSINIRPRQSSVSGGIARRSEQVPNIIVALWHSSTLNRPDACLPRPVCGHAPPPL